MSFLTSQGHPDAKHYPLCILWHEVDIARSRVREEAVTEALLIQAAVGSLLDKKGAENFQKLLKKMTSDGEEG